MWTDEAHPAEKPEVKPRHVLCFLGGAHELARLSDAAGKAIAEFAFEFSVDTDHSLDRPDPYMSRSFGLCWDRIVPNAWSQADAALMVVDRLIKEGAVAVKGESAGVAHGLDRWRTLFSQLVDAAKANDDVARPGLPACLRQAPAGGGKLCPERRLTSRWPARSLCCEIARNGL
jgi:hypothetical protein